MTALGYALAAGAVLGGVGLHAGFVAAGWSPWLAVLAVVVVAAGAAIAAQARWIPGTGAGHGDDGDFAATVWLVGALGFATLVLLGIAAAAAARRWLL